MNNETAVNKAMKGPSRKKFFSSSDVIATTCFGHTTIIRWPLLGNGSNNQAFNNRNISLMIAG
jgi:hypothetical protein